MSRRPPVTRVRENGRHGSRGGWGNVPALPAEHPSLPMDGDQRTGGSTDDLFTASRTRVPLESIAGAVAADLEKCLRSYANQWQHRLEELMQQWAALLQQALQAQLQQLATQCQVAVEEHLQQSATEWMQRVQLVGLTSRAEARTAVTATAPFMAAQTPLEDVLGDLLHLLHARMASAVQDLSERMSVDLNSFTTRPTGPKP